ncbi:MAG TPA: hypothetical protein VG738_04155 [Chitinophagaceae bacterium]|nr:hypothetical protein [Chitinophagaceae bacterium]
MKTKIISALIVFVTVYSCKHAMVPIGTDTTPIPVTPPPTDSTGNSGGSGSSDSVCFQSQVLPLYQTYCSRNSGCHSGNGGGDDGDDVVLTTYFNIMKGISPGLPQASRYFTIIGHGMPPRKEPAMTQDQLNIIQKWISQGALNTVCTGGTCDTSKYTYTNAASVIFATYCNGCHGNAPGSGNVILSSYSAAINSVNINKLLFINAINYSATPAQNMPPAGKLSNCQIQQLTNWVNKGMPQ